MSQELARQKRTQAALSLGGATLGLSALATKGGAVATRQALKRAPSAAARYRLTPKAAENMDKASLGLVTTASGVGGASGIHFAALQRAEAKKEDKVSKNAFGVSKNVVDLDLKREEADKKRARLVGQRAHRKAIEQGRFLRVDQEPNDNGLNPMAGKKHPTQQPVKAKPKRISFRRTSYSGIKPEDRRQRRMRVEQAGLAGGAVGAAAAGGGLGLVRRSEKKKVKAAVEQRNLWDTEAKTAQSKKERYAKNPKYAKATAKYTAAAEAARGENVAWNRIGLKHAGRARGAGRAAVAAGGTALALGAGAAGVRHMRRHQGKEYTDWWDG